MFGGQTRVPLVVREPFGVVALVRGAALAVARSLYAHIPGLVVA
jgi:pyruvate/2-oxoglutarate/acetoin dehydrogenase E1 component